MTAISERRKFNVKMSIVSEYDLPVSTPQSMFDGLFDLSSGGLPGSQAELQVQDR
jgi:hypothetical protein